jgi:hypothetical protein
MPPMRAPRLAPALLCLLAAGALIAGCGGGSSDESTRTFPGTAESHPAPPKSEFPAVEGRTLRQVLKSADGPAELVVRRAAEVFYPGENRYPFGVFNRNAEEEVSDAEVALYFSKVPEPAPSAKSKSGNRGQVAKAEKHALDQPAHGPFPAKIESLAAAPGFRAKATSERPDPASVIYSAELNLPGKGSWLIAALLKEDGELKGAPIGSVAAGQFKRIPKPGDKAPVIHTPTAEDVGGDLSKITTRVPPSTQNEVDYAEALGREPIVLLFASPEFCQSQVCGPVVDVAEQAKQEYGDKAAFIQMEIYNENDPAKLVRPQVRAFRLPSEPYLFAIDRDGIVRDTVEGAFGLKLMHEAVDKAIAP